MSKLDDALHEALSEEDAEFLARFEEEPHFLGLFFDMFSGSLRLVNIVIAIVLVPLLAVTLWAVIEFLNADDLRVMFKWFALASLCVIGLVLIRLWFLMSLQFNRVIREIKRLELQVARLAARESI